MMSAVGCGVLSQREVSNWEISGVDDPWNMEEFRLRLMLLKLSCMGCCWQAAWEAGWLAAWEAAWEAA